MKVLNILYRVMPSGAEKMLADAADAFKAAGVEGCVLANDDEDGAFAPVLRKKGYRIFRIPWRKSRLHLVEFCRLCRRERFDVVHIHVIRGYTSFAIAAKLAGVKTVVKTMHGLFKARDPMRRIVHSTKRAIARLVGTKMVAIGRTVQENERRTFFNPCRLIFNFADETGFPLASGKTGAEVRKELGVGQDKFVLLTVGNCHSQKHQEIKNHQLLIRALAALPTEKRNKVVYLHVGKEMEGFPERSLAEDLGVLENIRFLGSREDVWRMLSAANLFVMPSTCEGLGVSAIEAALSGREMLLAKAYGLLDFKYVLDSGVGYFELSPESLADAITKQMESSPMGACDGNAHMREQALATFSMKSGVASLMELYKGGEE